MRRRCRVVRPVPVGRPNFSRGEITGLPDIDTVGTGHRIDDRANFCAHLSSLAPLRRATRRINRFGAELLADAERHQPRRDLRKRIAATTLGLATGPFRTLEPHWESNTHQRLDLAERWLNDDDPVGPVLDAR